MKKDLGYGVHLWSSRIKGEVTRYGWKGANYIKRDREGLHLGNSIC